ncbi:MAG: hypothetical protein ACE5H4_14785 [Candidatus Thorarchaeota archaeon]
MTKDPMTLIDEYLERVKVYLPLDSESTLIEIRTHLIEEAEAIGIGEITVGTALMAIERMGDPKTVASEYAGTGKRVGLVPAEYTQPVLRIHGVLVGLGLAFVIAAYVIGSAFLVHFGIISEVDNWPFSLPLMILVNVIFVALIIGGVTLADKEKMPSEKTALESFLGIGTEGFRPKYRSDAVGDLVGGMIFGFILLLPEVRVLYSPAFVPFVTTMAGLVFLGALKGAMFLIGGENNLNLIFEAGLSAVWILFSTLLINVGFPLDYIWVNENGVWGLFNITEFFVENEIPFISFDLIWTFIIFIIVVLSTWRLIVASMKVPMYLGRGRGLWWQGDWGKRSQKGPGGCFGRGRGQWRQGDWDKRRQKVYDDPLERDREDRNNDSQTYQDGYMGN